MVSSIRKKLRSNLFGHKVPFISQYLNTIAIRQKYNPIIDIRCNDPMLRGHLVDGETDVNVMTIPAIKYIGLEIERPSLIISKKTNKIFSKHQGMISNVYINILEIFTIVNFNAMLEEDGLYPIILGRL